MDSAGAYSRVFPCCCTATGQCRLNGCQSRKGNPSSYAGNRGNGFLEQISSRRMRGLLLRVEPFDCCSSNKGNNSNLWCDLHCARISFYSDLDLLSKRDVWKTPRQNSDSPIRMLPVVLEDDDCFWRRWLIFFFSRSLPILQCNLDVRKWVTDWFIPFIPTDVIVHADSRQRAFLLRAEWNKLWWKMEKSITFFRKILKRI